jgi:phosphoribosyl 1,2-cyclic phosphate phosphodiesterase
VGPFRVSPLDVRHGPASIFGFLVEADGARFAYIPDCSALSDATIEHIRGCDLVALDSLRPEPHPTHLSLPESVRLLERIAARRSYLTHLSHRLGHRETEAGLHPGIRLAYDGLTLELPDVD